MQEYNYGAICPKIFLFSLRDRLAGDSKEEKQCPDDDVLLVLVDWLPLNRSAGEGSIRCSA